MVKLEDEAENVNSEARISQFQYQSMLFNNLGYDKCPKDLSWIDNNVPLENARLTEVLDYPITNNILLVNHTGDNLRNIMITIDNWTDGRKPMNGFLLAESKSFYIKDNNKLAYDLANNLEPTMEFKFIKREFYWDASNIIYTRFSQNNPEVDETYFKYCIKNSNKWFSQINVYYPAVAFAIGLINPEMLLSIIRQAEEIGCLDTTNKIYNGIYAIREDENTYKNVEKALNIILYYYNVIYVVYGPRALVYLSNEMMNKDKDIKNEFIEKLNYSIMNSMNLDVSRIPGSKFIDIGSFEKIDANSRLYAVSNYIDINNADVFDDIKRIVDAYVSNDSVPKQIDINESIYNSSSVLVNYKETIRTLYVMLLQIQYMIPEMIEGIEGINRFIVSQNFYIDSNNFAIYNKRIGLYVITYDNYRIAVMDADQIVKYYNMAYPGMGRFYVDSSDSVKKVKRIPDVRTPDGLKDIVENNYFDSMFPRRVR